MDINNCKGCRNDYYNKDGRFCWQLKTARVITRYKIHMDSPANVKRNYKLVLKPNCYDTGRYSGDGYHYLEVIPKGAK